MLQTVKEGLKSNQGNAVLYAGLLGLFLSDIIPTPADAIVFSVERKIRDKWKAGEITPQEYWKKKALAYYLLNPIWWAIVAGITVSMKGDATKKLKIASALIGSGAVIAVIYRNIKKDTKELEEESQHMKELLQSHPEYGQFFKDTQPTQFKNMSSTVGK
jgi:hypothetical protein